MTILHIIIGLLIYLLLALLVLRFMRFVATCDRTIRVMTKARGHNRRTIFKSPKKSRATLRLRPLSA